MQLIVPTPTHVRERDGHERAVPAAAEFRELRERAELSVRGLARELAPALGMSEASARVALAKMESGHTETVRRDLYEQALDVIRRAIIDREGELSDRDRALNIIANATPHLADSRADLAYVHDSIAHHKASIAVLKMMEADYVERAERPERAITDARAKLSA